MKICLRRGCAGWDRFINLIGETALDNNSKIGIRPIAVTSEIDVENNVQVNESIYSFWVAPFKKLNIAEVTQTDKIVSIINDAVFCFVDFRPDNKNYNADQT